MDRTFRPIVVAIEAYENPAWKPLDGVAKIAHRLAQIFGSIPLAFMDGGTSQEIPRAIGSILNNVPERSTLFIHWIGHGVTDGDMHYLVCRDSPAPSMLNNYTAVASGDFGRLIAQSSAERIVIILDTCFSGSGAHDLVVRYINNISTTLPREGWRRSAAVIASTHSLDKAVAGLFSQTLVEALENPESHLRWTRAQGDLDPRKVAVAVDDLLRKSNQIEVPDCLTSGLEIEIFPNPYFRNAEGNTDIETQRVLERIFGESVHFDLSARGIEAQETGFFFSGRHRILQNLCDWLASDASGVTIVTGPPGSGKSAVVGRCVTLSVPVVREKIEANGNLTRDDPTPPPNSIDVAVHVKGKSLFACARICAKALGIREDVADAAGLSRLLERVRTTRRPLALVFDALDEAADGQADQIVDELIRPLSHISGVKILVGVRRSLKGDLIPAGEERLGRLRNAFGPDATILDLERETETGKDIKAFVEKRLHAAKRRGSDTWIEGAAARVAAAADGNFLYARIVARSLEETPNAPIDALPADATAAFVEDIRSRFPDNQVRVTKMLRALAFGLGKGLSRKVWPIIAGALADSADYGDDDVVFMLRKVGSYIVETSVETDGRRQAVYRLIHQAMADHLRATAGANMSNCRIFDALSAGIESADWIHADCYCARHLAEHAVLADAELDQRANIATVQGGIEASLAATSIESANFGLRLPDSQRRLDWLLGQPVFLAAAEPEELIRHLNLVRGEEVLQVRDLYRLGIQDLRENDAIRRWAILHRLALFQGAPFARQFAPPASAPWRCLWANVRRSRPHVLIAASRYGVASVALGTINDRAVVVCGADDGTVQLWDAVTGAAIGAPLIGHESRVNSVALGTLDGRAIVVSGGEDGTVLLWREVTGAAMRVSLVGHEGGVSSVALDTIDGRTLVASGGSDCMVRLWDAAKGTVIGAPLAGHEGWVNSVALGTVDGRAVVVSSARDCTVRLWDLATRAGGRFIHNRRGFYAVALGAVGDRTFLVSTGRDRTVRIWDVAKRVAICEPLVGHEGRVNSVALGEVAGRAVAVSGGEDRTVRLWDPVTGDAIGAPLIGHEDRINSVALGLVDGRSVVVSGGDDGTVRLWPAAADDAFGVADSRRVYSISLGKIDGKSVVVSGGSDRALQRWDAATGAAIGAPLIGHRHEVYCVALGRVGGRELVVSGDADGSIRMWDAVTGAAVGAPLVGHVGSVNSIALGAVSERATIVSAGWDGTVRLWNAATGAAIGTPLMGHQRAVNSVALGTVADRAVVVSGGWDSTVRLWDATMGAAIGFPLVGHEGRVNAVALGIVNGRAVVVSGGQDRSIRMWDVASGTAIGAPNIGHERGVISVALGEVGGRLVVASGGADGKVVLWDANSRNLLTTVSMNGTFIREIMIAGRTLFLGLSSGLTSIEIHI